MVEAGGFGVISAVPVLAIQLPALLMDQKLLYHF